MISRTRLNELAQEWRLAERVVEKDYVAASTSPRARRYSSSVAVGPQWKDAFITGVQGRRQMLKASSWTC